MTDDTTAADTTAADTTAADTTAADTTPGDDTGLDTTSASGGQRPDRDRGAGSAEGRGYTVGSFIMAALAMLVIPPLHGILGVVLGYVGHRKGDPLGGTALVCSLVAMVVGSVLASVLFRSLT